MTPIHRRIHISLLGMCLLLGGDIGIPVFGQQPSLAKPLPPLPANSRLVDQLVASVNGEIITQSDLVWLIGLDPKAIVTNIEEDRLREALSRKIDQVLLDQEARQLPNVVITPTDIRQYERQLVTLFGSEVLFRQRLESIGLNSEMLSELVRAQIEIEKYTDFRFRSFVLVTDEEIKAAYTAEREQSKSSGTVLPEDPSEETYDRLQNQLLERKVREEIQSWLKTARTRAEIVPLAPFAQSVVAGQ